MGFEISSPHIICTFLYILFPCSSMESLLWETVFHKLLQYRSFPCTAVLQKHTAPAKVPHGFTSLTSQPAPVWALLSMGLQGLVGTCSGVGFPTGSHFLDVFSCSGVGSSEDCRCISAAPLTSMGCRVTAASPWPSPRGAEESLPWYQEHLLPFLRPWPWCL